MNDEVVRKLARFAFAEGVEAGVAQVRPAPDWRSTEGRSISELWEQSDAKGMIEEWLRLLVS
jgi:hypothetical protein